MSEQNVPGREKNRPDLIWIGEVKAGGHCQEQIPRNGHVYQIQAGAKVIRMTGFCRVRQGGIRAAILLTRTFPGSGIVVVLFRA